MDLFRTGNFVLSSGKKSRYKICCEMFSDSDLNTLCNLIRALVGPFSSVYGIPSGGTRLEQILKHYVDDHKEGPHLIVDDVLTSGRSMEQAKVDRGYKSLLEGCSKYIIGAVIFARGPLPIWIRAVCPLPKELWEI